jgi:predicted dehydrogenase
MTTPGDVAPGHGLRAAVTGVGHWHFSSPTGYLRLARASGLEIAGLSDDDEAVARRWADEVGCGWTTDVDDLVTRFRPDLVIALPRPDRALDQVGRLLDRGVPLIAEKPLGVNARETWQLVERAERGWVSVAFPQRYLPVWSAFERLREAGALGTIAHAGIRQINGPPSRYRADGVAWVLDPAQAGGGPLRNIAIHGVDLLVQLLGEHGWTVQAASQTHRLHGERVEDYITAIARTDDGVIATVSTGYTLAASIPGDMDITFAAQGAYLHQRRDQLVVTLADGQQEVVDHSKARNFYDVMFADALRRFRAGHAPFGTVRDCARANELIDAIYAAV